MKKIKEKERERMHSFYKIFISFFFVFFLTSLNCYSKNVFEFQLDYACLLTKFYFEIAVHSVHTHICFLNILYLLQTFILWNHRIKDLPFIYIHYRLRNERQIYSSGILENKGLQ